MSKVIAIMEKPKNCQECVFCVCKYSLPLSIYKKAYYCKLKEPKGRVAEEFDYDAEVYLSDCPLREIQKITSSDNLLDEYSDGYDDGWNACIDEILKGSEVDG